jgi:hypothetical protein
VALLDVGQPDFREQSIILAGKVTLKLTYSPFVGQVLA